MRRALGVLALAAGCDKTFGLLEITADPSVLDASMDTSGDGASSCWHAAYAMDEDNDGRADGCESCPADPMAALKNGDSDEVDDACDPHVGVAGDAIIDFDGFTATRDWAPLATPWSVSGGKMIAAASSGTTTIELTTIAAADHPVVDVIFDGPGLVGGYIKVGAINTLVRCEHETLSGTPDRIVLTIGTADGYQTFDVGSGPGRMRFGIDAAGSAFCHVQRGGAAFGDIVTVGSFSPPATTTIGLVAGAGGASYSSVTLFGQR